MYILSFSCPYTARTRITFIFNEFPENGIARIMKRRISKRENFRS
jgi:hypothetical protein